MKRIGILFLSFILCMPVVARGDMVGYGGDLRRYVTEEEKSQFPYNTVVKIKDGGSTGTGTFVSEDVILTCRHVVNNKGPQRPIEYYTADGKKHTGFIPNYVDDDKSETDFAWVIEKGAFSGRTLELAHNSKYSNNLMIIGYDCLKPLSNDEIRIIKRLYTDWIERNGSVTASKAFDAMVDIELQLRCNYACSSDNQTNCVHCSGEKYCIFHDNDNMKVRTNCKVTSIFDDQIYTNCPGAYGTSGSAIIDMETGKIIGIACEVGRMQIGQEKDAMILGTKPEYYYEHVKTWIDGLRNERNKTN